MGLNKENVIIAGNMLTLSTFGSGIRDMTIKLSLVISNYEEYVYNCLFKDIKFTNDNYIILFYKGGYVDHCDFENISSKYCFYCVRCSDFTNLNLNNCNFTQTLIGTSVYNSVHFNTINLNKVNANYIYLQPRSLFGDYSFKNFVISNSNFKGMVKMSCPPINYDLKYADVPYDSWNISNVICTDEIFNIGMAGYDRCIWSIKNIQMENITSSSIIYASNVVEGLVIGNINCNNITSSGGLFNISLQGEEFTNINLTNSNAVYGFSFNDGFIVSKFNFSNTNFTDCIAILGNDFELSDSNFSNFKGNLKVIGDKVKITNCNFTNGRNNVEYGNGSCIELIDGDGLILRDCIFTGNKAYNGGAVYIHNTTNSSYIFVCTFNDNIATGVGGGALFIEPGIYYYVDDETRHTFGDTLKENDFYHVNSLEYIYDIWVKLNPGSGSHTGDYDNPMSFSDAMDAIGPYGTIHFYEGETYSFPTVSYPYNYMELIKPGLTIIGNTTTLQSLRFIVEDVAEDLSIYNIIFTGNTEGSALIINSENCKIVNCTFTNNGGEKVMCGGAIEDNGAGLNIINSTFSNNVAGDDSGSYGGAIYCNANDLIISNCTFRNNRVYGAGCHIYLNETADHIWIGNGSTFRDGKILTGGAGSGIYITSINQVSIEDCIFVNNTGVNGGAIAITNVFSSSKLYNNQFENNTATKDGGAIAFTTTNVINLNMTKNTFKKNNAGANGGAIWSNEGLTISDSEFIENVASGNGGAILFYSTASATIKNSNFTHNEAQNGGAIYSNIAVNIDNSNFTSNVASVKGGALYLTNTNNAISNSNFKSNHAVDGSAIYLANGGALNLNKDTFENNIATGESTVYIGSDVTINQNDLKFDANTKTSNEIYIASSNYVSNVLYVGQPGTAAGATLNDPTTLSNAVNHIADGGKIIFVDNVDLADVVSITNQNIALVGNGFTITSSDNKKALTIAGSIVTIENLTFDEFTTSDYVVCYDSTSSGSVVDCNFTNQKSGTSALDIEGTVDVTDCLFKDNVVSSAALYYGSSATGTVSGSTFNNTHSLYLADVDAVTVTGNTFVCPSVTITAIASPVVYHSTVSINGTFDDGTNRYSKHDVNIYNGTQLINTATLDSNNKYSFAYADLLNGDYTITLAVVSDGNTYVYDAPSRSFTVSQANTIYIGPSASGDGSGVDTSNLATWDTIGNKLADEGTVYFTNGNYNLNGKSIDKPWNLAGSSANNVIISNGGSGSIFTSTVDGVKIENLTLKATNGARVIGIGHTIDVRNSVLYNQISHDLASSYLYGDTISIDCTFVSVTPSTLTAHIGSEVLGTTTVSGSTYTITRNGNLAVGSYTVTKAQPKGDIKNV